MKKIKTLKKFEKSFERKESELSCFKRIDISEIPLSLGLHPDRLQKTLTDGTSSEIDRAHARILLSPIVQKTLVKIKEAKGIEISEKFLQRNDQNIKKSALKKIDKKVEEKIVKCNENKKIDKKMKSKSTENKTKESVEPGKFVKNPKFQKLNESEDEDEESVIPKSADPFFVDVKNGSNYLAAVTNAMSDKSSDEDNQKMEVQKTKIKQNIPRKLPIERKTVAVRKNPEPQISNKNDELHPSWIAKQQQKKMQIQEFQGTKIKFDD